MTKPKAYIDVFVPFDKPVEGVNAATWTHPETSESETFEHGGIRIVVNKKVTEIARNIISELRKVRGLPINVNEVDKNHPYALFARAERNDEFPVVSARGHIETLLQELNTEGFTLAIAALSFQWIDREPKPYLSEEEQRSRLFTEMQETSTLRKDEFDFLDDFVNEGIKPFPSPKKNLDHLYESRLKVLDDIFNEQDLAWRMTFERKMEQALDRIYDLLRKEQTDEDRFQS